MEAYDWSSVNEFLDREAELKALETWWSGPERTPMSLYGRRRTGKSWLFRRFAHGKPAIVLVARELAPGSQLEDFATKLESALGVRPVVSNLGELFRLLHRAAHDRKLLVIIDEFPYLLPRTKAGTARVLTELAAVIEEERDDSELKLVLCGSLVSEMESLMAERGPLHGRLRPLQLHPVDFSKARLFLPEHPPHDQFERYAIAGGMPRYLSALAGSQALRTIVCREILSPNAALFNEGRVILEQELNEPKVYFALLESLATGDKDSGELASALRSDAQRTSKYLSVLTDMRLVERLLPAGAAATSRAGRWHLRDPFFRFWFRYVLPFQDDLESGTPTTTLYDTEIADTLAEHVGKEFEKFCQHWVRATQPVSRVAGWWGPALHSLRREGARSTEEIDIVATARGRVTLIGESRWRNRPIDVNYLNEIDTYKLPALRQSGLKVSQQPQIMLFSRSGYTDRLRTVANGRDDVTLVDVGNALQT
ncbi:MAG: ATP-binding protein [Acidothermaceae bacterium]